MADCNHLRWLLEGGESWNARREQGDFFPDFSGVDIYAEFREAGKLDSDGNIPLSGINLRKAKLQECCLCDPSWTKGADLSFANLSSANLQYAQLAKSRLDGASLMGARFGNANLHEASICDARMASSSFAEATLSGANLTGVKFANSHLVNADLSSAKLAGADLSDADLMGVKFEWARPWEAKLYRENRPVAIQPLQIDDNGPINRVADLISKCTNIGLHDTDYRLYFRGEKTNAWKLRPSVMRCSTDGKFSFRAKESEMLLDLMSRRPEDFNDSILALSQWVLAQHHRLKTRLLDVTRNPLVALFAACELSCNTGLLHIFAVPRELVKPFNSDTISVIANFCKLSRSEQNSLLGWSMEDIQQSEPDLKFGALYEQAMDRLYHLVRQEKPHFENRIDPRDFYRVFVVEPQQSFERIRAQSGAFLISAFHERFERGEVRRWNSEIPIYRHIALEVPEESKQDISAELSLLNITRETLFPGLDEAAKAITNANC